MILKLLIVTIIFEIEASRILFIVPSPSLSHNLFFQPVIKALCARGHQVISITADLIQTPVENLTQIDIRNETYQKLSTGDWLATTQKENSGMVESLRKIFQLAVIMTEAVLTKPEVQDIYDNQKFDLIILENLGYSIFHQWKNHFNCPLVGISSLDLFVTGSDNVGAPIFPSYHVDIHGFSGELSFWKRLTNFCFAIECRWFWYQEVVPTWTKLHEKIYGEDLNFYELQRNYDLVLINSNFAVQTPRPLPPAVIQIGGIHARDLEQLPVVSSCSPKTSHNGR